MPAKADKGLILRSEVLLGHKGDKGRIRQMGNCSTSRCHRLTADDRRFRSSRLRDPKQKGVERRLEMVLLSSLCQKPPEMAEEAGLKNIDNVKRTRE